MSRTLVIGDIHGCYDELVELLEKANLSNEDRVVAVGDLIVKGPKNQDVLELFMEDHRFTSVIGNHDLAVLNFWKGENVALKPQQQQACLELKESRDRYAAFFDSCPFILDLSSHVVVHAGIRPGISLSDQSPEDLVELRTLGEDRTSREGTPWYADYTDGPTILFGHWPAPEPRKSSHALGLDTGCVYGHQLTAYVLETNEFYAVQARQIYDRRGPGFKKAMASSLNLE